MRAQDILKIIKRATAPLKNKIAMLVGRCAILAINDTEGMQKVKIAALAGETLDNIERFQNYGLTSNPPENSEGVTVFPLGNREHGICIALDNRKFRLKNLGKGEVALYTDEGDKIHFKRGNKIEIIGGEEVSVQTKSAIVTATNGITLNGTVSVDGDIEATGNISSDGNVSDSTGSMQGMRDTFNTHTHPETNVPGGSTNAPTQQMT